MMQVSPVICPQQRDLAGAAAALHRGREAG
jgi:hypothetical protein